MILILKGQSGKEAHQSFSETAHKSPSQPTYPQDEVQGTRHALEPKESTLCRVLGREELCPENVDKDGVSP